MAYWGKAIALGPNYNMPWHLMDRLTKSKLLGGAHGAMSLALANLDGCTAGEVALIEALESRYPQADPIEDQMPWNKAFTNAMRTVQQAHPEDRDIAAVFVDAILNETPWQMWNLKTGGVADGAGTVEAREVLEHAFATMPSTWEHPGLLHLYVHLMEMSPFPELAHGDVAIPRAGAASRRSAASDGAR